MSVSKWIARSACSAALLLLLPATAACAADRSDLRYRTLRIENADIFVREAGAPSAPAILLLHGNPSSSHMFRDVIPDLAARFHVIAPDYPGFGYSSAPPPESFKYSFDHYAGIVRGVLAKLNVHRFGLMMQDYGVPVGFRLASSAPHAITFLVVQNGQICHAAHETKTWLDPFWDRRDPAAEARLRRSYVLKATKLYYSLGAHEPSKISPDAWTVDQFQMDQPGSKDARTEITYDYPSNFRSYATWQAYLRKYRPPTLVIWGKEDPLFTVDQSRCYAANNPGNTTTKYFEGGHFMLEEHAHDAALEILKFTARLHLD